MKQLQELGARGRWIMADKGTEMVGRPNDQEKWGCGSAETPKGAEISLQDLTGF